MDVSWRKCSFSSVNGGECVEVGTWRKSSYSSSNGGNCLEAGTWRKSSHSSVNGGNCVETASGGAVAVRDTKDDGHGPVLHFPPAAWATFTATLR
jgi:hypothetical protein